MTRKIPLGDEDHIYSQQVHIYCRPKACKRTAFQTCLTNEQRGGTEHGSIGEDARA